MCFYYEWLVTSWICSSTCKILLSFSQWNSNTVCTGSGYVWVCYLSLWIDYSSKIWQWKLAFFIQILNFYVCQHRCSAVNSETRAMSNSLGLFVFPLPEMRMVDSFYQRSRFLHHYLPIMQMTFYNHASLILAKITRCLVDSHA